MKRDYDALLKAGNQAQLEKLKQNEHKSGFDVMTQQEISELIDEEFDELTIEMNKQITDFKLMRHEAADLKNACNFMIILCDKELNK